MTRNEIIEAMYRTQSIERYTRSRSKYFRSEEDLEDFIQHIYLAICELPEDKIIRLYTNKQLVPYVMQIITNNLFNDRSKYHKLMEHDVVKVFQGTIDRLGDDEYGGNEEEENVQED